MISVLPQFNYKTMPWKNGLGVTEEIALEPATATLNPANFRWRLSRAKITQPGPFSLYPGYDRLLCIASGPGIILNGKSKIQTHEVFHFSGEEKIHCELLGEEVLDVGLIYHRDLLNAQARLIRIPQKEPITIDLSDKEEHHYFYVLEGPLLASGLQASAGDTLYCQGLAATQFQAPTTEAALIHWQLKPLNKIPVKIITDDF